MEEWRKNVSMALTAVSFLAAVFLAYSNVTQANAVQDVKIDIHDKALITLKGDLLERMVGIEYELRELRKELSKGK